MKKTLVFLLVCLMAIIGTTLLGTTQTEAAGQAEFRTAIGFPPPPAWHGNPFGPGGVGGLWWILYEPAFYFIPGTGEFIPRLAVSKELLDGGERLILHLREGVVWHDGDPFCSKDVLTTWNLIRALWAWPQEIVEIEALDDHTVEFRFIGPLPIQSTVFMSETMRAAHHIFGGWDNEALAIIELQKEVWALEGRGEPVPEALSAELTEKRAALTEEVVAFRPLVPIGTGAFSFVEVHPFEIYLTKFAEYWAAETTHFDALRLYRWVAHELLWGQLQVGEIDASHPSTGVDLAEAMLAMQPKLRLVLAPDLAEFVIFPNHRRFPFYIPEFRHALLHVLDRTTIRNVSMPFGLAVDVFNHGVLKSLEGAWLSPEFLAGLTRFDHNPARAEALLLELGFARGPDGNWLDHEGRPLEFVMRPYGPHTDWVLAGTEAAAQLTAFGIPTTVLTVPPGMRPAVFGAGDFDLGIEFGAAWWGTGHPFTGFSRIFAGAWLQEFAGYEKYPVVTIDGVTFDTGAILDELAITVDPERTRELVEKLAFVMNEWAPVLSFAEKTLMIFHVDGVRVTGWPDADDPVWTLAPGGIERVYMLLITTGVLRPVQ